MAVLKCKMCGGDLNIVEGSTIAECEYCGTTQTVPSADNEKKMTLFARAERLRSSCEFDKASGIYESIIADFPEEAEAYWGLLLCKYGIEYVDDPATGKKIPTCHRSSFDSIMEDDDFEQVMENADSIARKVYREEAKTIEEIRKGILEVSSKEEPYDVFICYKETNENGERTIDSVIAQDIYDNLTEKGYRVFFARISLEDKLGTAYEPYIFAALNSAKIMLAIGTDYDYYNAVWVKNEWSRFLALIAKGKKKTLIPCYKDIDAYDIPKEFKHLQAQDMGKVGAMQDLLRGIGKILNKEKTPNKQILSEKEKRAYGPDLIHKIKLVEASGEEDYYPNRESKNSFDKGVKYLSIQIVLKERAGYEGEIEYQNRIYDSMNNLVSEVNMTSIVHPDNAMFAAVWRVEDIDAGQYRIESWIKDSRVYEYNFRIVDSTGDNSDNKPIESSFSVSDKAKRKDGPSLIRTIFLVGTDNENDCFPNNNSSNYVDIAKYSHLAMQMALYRPIGYTGEATYNYKIFDGMDNLILDDTRTVNVIPNYDRFSLVWILRGDDGTQVAVGQYRMETWINDSRVFEYKFQVIDSSNRFSNDNESDSSSDLIQSLLAERKQLELELRNTVGLFSGKRKRVIQNRIIDINSQIKSLV